MPRPCGAARRRRGLPRETLDLGLRGGLAGATGLLSAGQKSVRREGKRGRSAGAAAFAAGGGRRGKASGREGRFYVRGKRGYVVYE